jgi:hypothetical protein
MRLVAITVSTGSRNTDIETESVIIKVECNTSALPAFECLQGKSVQRKCNMQMFLANFTEFDGKHIRYITYVKTGIGTHDIYI